METRSADYIGRFAPSPSGPLHFGSLITALGSYLQARQRNGVWRLRIDDIDPPRQMPQAERLIQQTLEAHGLLWDETVYFQSQQSEHYRAALAQLIGQNRAFHCDCTRKMVKASGGWYTGTCRDKALPAQQGMAIRLRNETTIRSFTDLHYGQIALPPQAASEDFIVHRRDGLFAYHLASVTDDIAMGITEVVRGADLLIPSGCQIALYQAFNAPVPDYIHLPLAVTKPGMKLSKQNHAEALDDTRAGENLQRALAFLGHPVPADLIGAKPDDILAWATKAWRLSNVPTKRELQI